MRFHVVDDAVPKETMETLQEAASARDIALVVHNAMDFVFKSELKLGAGELLFRPAVSLRAQRVEQFLFHPDCITFYRQPLGAWHQYANALSLFDHADVPTPRAFYLNNASRAALDFYVEQLGDFPVVLKVLGHSSGIGVIKIDNKAALYSTVDYMLASGQMPVLSSFIDCAEHWRCVVVGDGVVASYLNPVDHEDFRTYGSQKVEDIRSGADKVLSEIAVNATHCLGYDFGGVDILKHESGRCYVLECNFPCYFAHAQLFGKVDVAGAMLDYLLYKRRKSGFE